MWDKILWSLIVVGIIQIPWKIQECYGKDVNLETVANLGSDSSISSLITSSDTTVSSDTSTKVFITKERMNAIKSFTIKTTGGIILSSLCTTGAYFLTWPQDEEMHSFDDIIKFGREGSISLMIMESASIVGASIGVLATGKLLKQKGNLGTTLIGALTVSIIATAIDAYFVHPSSLFLPVSIQVLGCSLGASFGYNGRFE